MKYKITTLILATLLVSTASLATNGTRLLGFGTKMNGRGGTGIAMFDSPSLMLTNPAGLSFYEGEIVGLNLADLAPTTKFKNNLNDKTGKKNNFPLGGIGYIGRPLMNDKLSWGVGAFTLGGMGADYDLNHALFVDQSGNYLPQKYHSMISLLQAGPSVAYKITPKFSVGTTLAVMYSGLELQMPFAMPPSIMKGMATPNATFGQLFAAQPLNYTEVTAAAEMKDLAAYGFNARLGCAFKANDKLTLGLNYVAPTPLKFKSGTANMDMTAQFNNAFTTEVAAYAAGYHVSADSAMRAVGANFHAMGIDASLGMKSTYDCEVKLTNPQSIGIGAGYKASKKVNLSMDAEWINWKDAYDKMTVTLTNGSNPNINRMLGTTGLPVDFQMQWKNSIMLRLGGEYLLNPKTILRLGYAYGSNPVPSSTLFSVFPAIVQHHVTVGGSYSLTRDLSVHAAYEYAFNNKLNADTNSIIGHEYNGSTDQLSGMLFNLGFGWGVR